MLLDTAWSQDALAFDQWKAILGKDATVAFRGPRLKMSIVQDIPTSIGPHPDTGCAMYHGPMAGRYATQDPSSDKGIIPLSFHAVLFRAVLAFDNAYAFYICSHPCCTPDFMCNACYLGVTLNSCIMSGLNSSHCPTRTETCCPVDHTAAACTRSQ